MTQYDDDANRWGDDEDDEFDNVGTCQRCGGRVEFIHSGVRWRLYEPGSLKLHVCVNQASPDEFDAC